MPGKSKETADKKKSLDAKKAEVIVPVYALDGKEVGKLVLPETIFGRKANNPLIAQAIRVYQNNQSGHFSNTKTRGEVRGSTRKIRVQKGTGGARHGAVRAPIFIGGGIALGPKSRKKELSLSKKMKKAALLTALSDKVREKEVLGLTGLEKLSGKTSQLAKLLAKLEKRSALMLFAKNGDKLQQAARNLPGIQALPAKDVSIFDLLRFKTLLLGQETVEELNTRIFKPQVEEAAKVMEKVTASTLKNARVKRSKKA